MEQRTILLVEDNEDLNEINRRTLEREGYEVLTALTLAAARAHLSHADPDVILLDVLLPDGNGIDFCGEIQERTQAHIIFLTSRIEHETRLRGLDTGGDYYMTKPYKLDEMLSSVRAALRRRKKAQAKRLTFGNLALDMGLNRAFVDGADLNLTPREFALLRLLAENEDKTLDTAYIYQAAWGLPMGADKNAIRMTAYRLRHKLEQAGYHILAKRNEGYTFTKK
jgi:DNA-binding response OmpR family regulator